LLIAGVTGSSFTVWIIPHSLEATHLVDLQDGDPVHV